MPTRQRAEKKTLTQLYKHCVRAENGCLLWQGARTKKGYPTHNVEGKDTYVHRTAYTLQNGPIAVGLQIDHLCRNHACINADHLQAVTAQENTLRGEGLAAVYARRTHCKNGHEWTPCNISWAKSKRLARPFRRCLACERERKQRLRLASAASGLLGSGGLV